MTQTALDEVRARGWIQRTSRRWYWGRGVAEAWYDDCRRRRAPYMVVTLTPGGRLDLSLNMDPTGRRLSRPANEAIGALLRPLLQSPRACIVWGLAARGLTVPEHYPLTDVLRAILQIAEADQG